MARATVKINTKIMRECREQIGMTVGEVAKKIPKIKEIEAGEKEPTLKQMGALSDLYRVPRWVFVAGELPRRYKFATMPAFRKFAKNDADGFGDAKVRALVASVEKLRELVLDLREEQDEPIKNFFAPEITGGPGPMAAKIRKWLGCGQKSFKFEEWRRRVEAMGVFVFMTGKYQGWSKIDGALFRGLSVYYPRLPFFIINDSDAKKAQSFTLFHEFGHILRKETVFDGPRDADNSAEKWCNEFAANFLMPAEFFAPLARADTPADLRHVKAVANKFKVSPASCLLRMRHLRIISAADYGKISAEIEKEYAAAKQRMAAADGPPIHRNRAAEVIRQYGDICSRTVVQSFMDREIGLSTLCRWFGLKRPINALEIIEALK